MSAKGSLPDLRDIKSALRHTIIPLVAGGAIAGLEALQVGGFNVEQVKTAVISAVVAGLIRLLQRWRADMPQ